MFVLSKKKLYLQDLTSLRLGRQKCIFDRKTNIKSYMKKNIFTLLVCLMVSCFGFAQNNVIDNELQTILNQKSNDYIDVNIMLKAQMTSDDFAVLNCKSDSKEVRREIVTNELKKFAKESQSEIMSVLQAEERNNKVTDIQNFWIANFINCKAKADVIYQLASHPDVATISYNSVMEVVSDTEETNSSNTRAITATIGEHLTRIKAEKAWELGYTGKDVVVAVLDSGVNTEHADLKDHLWNGTPQHGYNVVDPGQNPYDDRSHGTHCAGIVCGDGTSGVMTGVAPDAQLMSIKLYSDGSGLTVPRLVTGVQFAIDNGAHILNISQGWLGATEANRQTLRTTFENLLKEGIVAVVAAGNDRGTIDENPVPGNIRTPGDCPPPWLHPDQTLEGGVSSVVSVGAVTYDENNIPSIAAISSQGPVEWNDYPYNPGMGLIRPDIVAPGTIRSLSNTSNDQYATKGGTSQAAPCVAGVMALMLEKNPDLTPEDLCRIVETTATKKTDKKDNLYGSGVVDALEAVRYADFDVNAAVLSPYAFSSKLDAGSNVSFELTLINNGEAATNGTTNVTISENDAYTTIIEGSKTYSTMAVDATASATFVVSFDHLIPDNYEVTFTITAGTRTFNLVATVYNELVPPTLTATVNGTDINLSWNETNNATSYNIYRDGVLLKNTTSTSYTDAGLKYGTIYAYNVTTKRNDLESEHSLTVRVQTVDNPDKPSPTNVVATNNGTNASVTWTNGAESKGSHIYRKNINASVETSIATNVNGASYTDNTWNSLADGIYQYGVANLYAQNEKIYEEGFEGSNSWTFYNEGWSYGATNWSIKGKSQHGDYTPRTGSNAAFFNSTAEDLNYLSYLVSPQFDFTEHNGNTVKLSFYYRTPEWPNYPQCVNRLRVRIGTSPTGPWEETSLWSNNQVSVANWTKVEIDLSAYVNSTFYIAFENATMSGHCSAVDDINISIEGSSESRIEWSNNVYKNVNVFVQDGNWSNTNNWSAKRLPYENENVIIDANATVTSVNITVYSLLINEGKSLTLNDGVKLTVTDDFVNNDADAFVINDGAQVFQNNDDVAATFNMNIVTPGDWSNNHKNGWQFISSPVKGAKIDDFIPATSDYDLYKYDGTKELEWINHKDENTYEPVLPTAPQNLLADPISTSTIRLSWDAVADASSYKVYFDATNFISTASNTFEVTGLMPGTEYCYSVSAVNAHGESDKSEACTKTITLAPQNLVANMASHSSIVLSWNPVDGAERYVVYKDSEVLAQFVTNPYYTVEGLTQATEYCFTVTAVNYLDGVNGKESAHSNEACATTDITIPSAPQNLVADAAPYSATLRGDAVAGAESYNIYLLNEVVGTTTSPEYTITGLNPEETYVYHVTAVNTKGESARTGVEFTTPLPTPEAPQLAATAAGPATVELTWNATDFAETYKVYEGNRLVVEGISSITYTVYDLEAGQHCFTVVAVNSVGGESDASNTACATTTAQDPDTPIAEHIIIGDGNSTTGVLPLTSNQAYSISQQIYTRAEMQQTGEIKSVSFKYKSGLSAPCTRTVKVYLKQTTKEVFASKTDWLSMTDDADLVYDGNITINGIADEWVRIKLNTPFEYTGNNLAVCVYDYTNKVDDQIIFAADEIGDAKAMYYYNWISPAPLNPSNVNKDGNIPSPTKRNQIRFSFVTGNEPGIPAAPTNLIASCSQEMPDIDVYANAITLTWDADATAETYHIYDEGGNKIGQTGGTTFTIEGLECAKRYCYYVSAENETGEGAKAEVCTTTITEVPQNVVARSTDETTINMSWDPVETATSYNVYLSDLLVGTSTTTSCDITGLTTGDYYCYSVTAVNEGGESKKSALDCATAGDIQLEMCNIIFTLYDLPWGDGWRKGSKITVSYEGAGPIDLTTPPYDPEEDAYKETPHTLSIPKGTEVTVTYTRSANEISTGESYNIYQNSFDVKCENGVVLLVTNAEELEGGETFTFIADCTLPLPNAPVLEANATSSTEIALTWNEVATATSYNVYQGSTQIANGLTETSYNVTGLTANTEYCFTVTAVNVTGESDASEEVCEKTLLATPANLLAEANGENSIILTWDAVAGATSYKIYSGETVIATVTETTYTKELLVAGTEYCYAVSAVNNDSESAKTAPACATTDEAAPEELCKIIFTLNDQYTDGWIGTTAGLYNYLLVEYNGNSIEYTLNIGNKTIDYTLEIPKGTVVTVTYHGMQWAIENSFVIKYEDGNVINEVPQGSLTNETIPYPPFTVNCSSTTPDDPITPETPEIPEGTPTTFFYDFNDGSLDAFNLIDDDGDGNNWEIGSQYIMSYSWKSGIGNLIPDNYIVTKEAYAITATSKLTYKVNSVGYPDFYAVVVSENGNDFEIVYEESYKLTSYEPREINLSKYAGKELYIGFRHYNCTGQYYIVIDDIELTDGSAKSSAPAAKMTDIKGGFDKVSAFGTSSGTELSKFETTFEQGVGYLASYEIETIATFKGTLNHEDSYVFKLDDYDNNKNVGNFNLLGNPFSFNMNWENVTVTNLVDGYAVVNKQGGYEYFADGEIKVGDGFLVKVSGEGPALSYNTRSRKTENEISFLNVVSSGKAGNDNVIIKLAGEQENFPKLENFNDDIAVIYVSDDNKACGIYNCNDDVQEVSIIFKASRMGEYNIHIKPNGDFDYVTLVDRLANVETNMLTSSYSFTTIPEESGDRFLLKFAKGEGSDDDDKFAFLSGNELIVEAEGTVQIIDVMGRVVYSNDVTSDNNRIDTSKFNTAAYIIRLINDNGVKTQKIVVY